MVSGEETDGLSFEEVRDEHKRIEQLISYQRDEQEEEGAYAEYVSYEPRNARERIRHEKITRSQVKSSSVGRSVSSNRSTSQNRSFCGYKSRNKEDQTPPNEFLSTPLSHLSFNQRLAVCESIRQKNRQNLLQEKRKKEDEPIVPIVKPNKTVSSYHKKKIEARTKRKFEERHRQISQEKNKSYSFSPSINNSRGPASRSNEQRMRWYNQKEEKLQVLRAQAVPGLSQRPTFRPYVSAKSKKFARQAEERSQGLKGGIHQSKQEFVEGYLEKEKEWLGKPKIMSYRGGVGNQTLGVLRDEPPPTPPPEEESRKQPKRKMPIGFVPGNAEARCAKNRPAQGVVKKSEKKIVEEEPVVEPKKPKPLHDLTEKSIIERYKRIEDSLENTYGTHVSVLKDGSESDRSVKKQKKKSKGKNERAIPLKFVSKTPEKEKSRKIKKPQKISPKRSSASKSRNQSQRKNEAQKSTSKSRSISRPQNLTRMKAKSTFEPRQPGSISEKKTRQKLSNLIYNYKG